MSRLKRQLSRLSGCGTPTGAMSKSPAGAMDAPPVALLPAGAAPAGDVSASPGLQASGTNAPVLAAGAISPAAAASLAYDVSTLRVDAPDMPDDADAAQSAQGRAARLAALRTRLATYRGRRRLVPKKQDAALQVLPGTWEETPEGGMHVVRLAYPKDHAHGIAPLAHSLRATGPHMAVLALDDSMSDVASADMLYLDTETTGLAGGAGTLPFLIGMGRFVAGCWEMEQLFLRRPGDEAPMLHHLAARMRSASAIVTYNGKSFDWPLLRTRFVLNRVPVPPPLPHLDLLHCARRLLPQLAGGARLCHVERSLLAFERVDDVDGALIPQLYFDFLRGGSAGPMAQVMTHNAHDLAALAAMLGVFAARLEASPVVTVSAGECLAMARLHERRGDAVQAHAWAERAAGGPGDLQAGRQAHAARLTAAEAHMLRARLHVRARAFARGVDAWLQALEHLRTHAPLRAEVRLALAKVYEHRLKNVPLALEHAAHTQAAEGPLAMAHRVARLQRKLEQAIARQPA